MPDVDYRVISLLDMSDQDLLGSGLLKEALEYIEDAVEKKEPILVHW